MKPWPVAIGIRFPLPHAPVVAARPWWEKLAAKKGVAQGWRRRDGVTCPAEGNPALVDGLQPLPHPGFRVGQVWSDAAGNAKVVQGLCVDGTPWVLHDTTLGFTGSLRLVNPIYLVADPACPWLAPWSPA